MFKGERYMKKDYNIQVLSEFDHPVGLQYIHELLRRKIRIKQVIFTQRRKYPDILRQFKERMGDDFILKKTKDILHNTRIPCYFVDDINSSESVSLVRLFSPDLIIVSAVGIIEEKLLRVPKIGILNCHPGIFPKYRGCTCVEWAIYNDDAVGCTCHFMTEEIDWGRVEMVEGLKLKKGDSYNDVRKKSFYQCAEVMARTVEKIIKNGFIPGGSILDGTRKRYFKPISEEKMAIVRKKLKDLEYGHYSD